MGGGGQSASSGNNPAHTQHGLALHDRTSRALKHDPNCGQHLYKKRQKERELRHANAKLFLNSE